jgi:GAF domain-containing protein
MVVGNVHDFPGHIACDAASCSEIVVPLISHGRLLGVLDVDSPDYDRFTDSDRIPLEQIAQMVVQGSRW